MSKSVSARPIFGCQTVLWHTVFLKSSLWSEAAHSELEGRGGDGEPIRRTPWGEIGWQLAGDKGFAAVKQHDEQGIAPAGDVIRRMLPDEPVLILMDELLNYVSRARKLGMRDQFFNFMQSLAEEARARNNMILCASIPKFDFCTFWRLKLTFT